MKNFIKISVFFLVFFLLCRPLSAADDSLEDKVLQVQRLTLTDEGVWAIEFDNGVVQRLKVSPQQSEELLQQIKKEKLESGLPEDQDYGSVLGGVTAAAVQFWVPGGVPFTTLTGVIAKRFFGTTTLTEAAIKGARPMKPIRPAFKGLKKILNLSGTHRIVNLGLCKPENIRNLYKGQLARITPKKPLTKSFMGVGVTYVEFLIGEDAASQETVDALWNIDKVEIEIKEHKESHYIIVHSKTGHLLTYTQALWGGPWSGYYCHVEAHPKSLEKRFLWDIYYHPEKKVHLLKNVACYPGLLCYTKDQAQNGPYGQVLIQSIGSQLNVEEYYLDGLHRSSIEFRLPRYDNYDKKPLSPPSLLPLPQENPPVNDSYDFIFDEDGYMSSDSEKGKDYLSYDLGDDMDEWGFVEAPLGLTNGVYKIRNCDLSSLAKNPDRNPNVGLLLPISSKSSQSGYYAGVLDAQHSVQYNVPDQQDLWEIHQVEGEYYTIKSHDFSDGGLLTWVNKSTYSGFYGQVLGNNGSRLFNSYPDEKAKYEQNGEFRNDVLWRLTEESHNGSIYYTLKNKGDTFKSDEGGFLCYTSDLSPVGPYMQILDSSAKYFKQDQEKYQKSGEFWPSILWELSLVKSSPS